MWIFIKKRNKCKWTSSTSLYRTAFYNQDLIVQLLLEYEANTSIRNRFGDLPSDDASQLIRDNILNSQQDQISILSND